MLALELGELEGSRSVALGFEAAEIDALEEWFQVRPVLHKMGVLTLADRAPFCIVPPEPETFVRSCSARPEMRPPGTERAAEGDEEAAADKAGPRAEAAPAPRTTRPGTKQATLIEMLRAQQGATIAEICDATSWQAHSVRGAFAGALKKRLGLQVVSEKVEGRGRIYRLPPASQ